MTPRARLRVLGAVDLVAPDGTRLDEVVRRPKRLAVLAYLALATPSGFHRRDTLLGLFWPDVDQDRARAALRQTIYGLGQALGDDVIVRRGGGELGVAADRFWCDAAAFRQALDHGREKEALALYGGDALVGLYVPGAGHDLQDWIAALRAGLRRSALAAAMKLSDSALASGNSTDARKWAEWAIRHDPADESIVRGYMRVLAESGDRAGSLRAYEQLSTRLRSELDAAPSAETTALADSLRTGGRNTHPRAQIFVAPSLNSDQASPGLAPELERKSKPLLERNRAIIAVVAAIAAIVVAVQFGAAGINRSGASASVPVVAVGSITESGLTEADSSAGDAAVLRELLATDLARVSGLNVVSHARIIDLVGQIRMKPGANASIEDAALQAGATEILEGVLSHRDGNPETLRLDLRRTQLKSGDVTEAYTAEGPDLLSLVESVASQFAASLGTRAPNTPIASISGTLPARRLYEHGLREYYQGDRAAATRFFTAALEEDSSFGMAAYYASRADDPATTRRVLPLLERAAKNASRAPERERLIVRHAWAVASNEPSVLALAESLAVRYPNDLDGERALGSALIGAGEFTAAIAHLTRAVSADSLSFFESRRDIVCRACNSMEELVIAYLRIDSVGAAERTARKWVALQPNSPSARITLAEVLARKGSDSEALTELGRAARESPGMVRGSWLDGRLLLRAGEFEKFYRLLDIRASEADPSAQEEALWWRVIGLRYEGRLAAADAAARQFCLLLSRNADGSSPPPECPLAHGPVLFEAGRYREAAKFYESLANGSGYRKSDDNVGETGIAARRRVWNLTHAASAYAALRDTQALARIADSVEFWGLRSAYGRDRRLHFHIRGLLAVARGKRTDAIANFRRAIYSLSDGYTRTNLELGRLLTTAGHPADAIGVLRPALTGPIQSSNMYATHTEIHEQIALAFDALGKRDSAAVHYRWVARAWNRAEDRFRQRTEMARRKSLMRAEVQARP